MALATGAIVGIAIGASVAACASAGVAKLLWHERGIAELREDFFF
jgi:hypothetical protein